MRDLSSLIERSVSAKRYSISHLSSWSSACRPYRKSEWIVLSVTSCRRVIYCWLGRLRMLYSSALVTNIAARSR